MEDNGSDVLSTQRKITEKDAGEAKLEVGSTDPLRNHGEECSSEANPVLLRPPHPPPHVVMAAEEPMTQAQPLRPHDDGNAEPRTKTTVKMNNYSSDSACNGESSPQSMTSCNNVVIIDGIHNQELGKGNNEFEDKTEDVSEKKYTKLQNHTVNEEEMNPTHILLNEKYYTCHNAPSERTDSLCVDSHIVSPSSLSSQMMEKALSHEDPVLLQKEPCEQVNDPQNNRIFIRDEHVIFLPGDKTERDYARQPLVSEYSESESWLCKSNKEEDDSTPKTNNSYDLGVIARAPSLVGLLEPDERNSSSCFTTHVSSDLSDASTVSNVSVTVERILSPVGNLSSSLSSLLSLITRIPLSVSNVIPNESNLSTMVETTGRRPTNIVQPVSMQNILQCSGLSGMPFHLQSLSLGLEDGEHHPMDDSQNELISVTSDNIADSDESSSNEPITIDVHVSWIAVNQQQFDGDSPDDVQGLSPDVCTFQRLSNFRTQGYDDNTHLYNLFDDKQVQVLDFNVDMDSSAMLGTPILHWPASSSDTESQSARDQAEETLRAADGCLLVLPTTQSSEEIEDESSPNNLPISVASASVDDLLPTRLRDNIVDVDEYASAFLPGMQGYWFDEHGRVAAQVHGSARPVPLHDIVNDTRKTISEHSPLFRDTQCLSECGCPDEMDPPGSGGTPPQNNHFINNVHPSTPNPTNLPTTIVALAVTTDLPDDTTNSFNPGQSLQNNDANSPAQDPNDVNLTVTTLNAPNPPPPPPHPPSTNNPPLNESDPRNNEVIAVNRAHADDEELHLAQALRQEQHEGTCTRLRAPVTAAASRAARGARSDAATSQSAAGGVGVVAASGVGATELLHQKTTDPLPPRKEWETEEFDVESKDESDSEDEKEDPETFATTGENKTVKRGNVDDARPKIDQLESLDFSESERVLGMKRLKEAFALDASNPDNKKTEQVVERIGPANRADLEENVDNWIDAIENKDNTSASEEMIQNEIMVHLIQRISESIQANEAYKRRRDRSVAFGEENFKNGRMAFETNVTPPCSLETSTMADIAYLNTQRSLRDQRLGSGISSEARNPIDQEQSFHDNPITSEATSKRTIANDLAVQKKSNESDQYEKNRNRFGKIIRIDTIQDLSKEHDMLNNKSNDRENVNIDPTTKLETNNNTESEFLPDDIVTHQKTALDDLNVPTPKKNSQNKVSSKSSETKEVPYKNDSDISEITSTDSRLNDASEHSTAIELDITSMDQYVDVNEYYTIDTLVDNILQNIIRGNDSSFEVRRSTARKLGHDRSRDSINVEDEKYARDHSYELSRASALIKGVEDRAEEVVVKPMLDKVLSTVLDANANIRTVSRQVSASRGSSPTGSPTRTPTNERTLKRNEDDFQRQSQEHKFSSHNQTNTRERNLGVANEHYSEMIDKSFVSSPNAESFRRGQTSSRRGSPDNILAVPGPSGYSDYPKSTERRRIVRQRAGNVSDSASDDDTVATRFVSQVQDYSEEDAAHATYPGIPSTDHLRKGARSPSLVDGETNRSRTSVYSGSYRRGSRPGSRQNRRNTTKENDKSRSPTKTMTAERSVVPKSPSPEELKLAIHQTSGHQVVTAATTYRVRTEFSVPTLMNLEEKSRVEEDRRRDPTYLSRQVDQRRSRCSERDNVTDVLSDEDSMQRRDDADDDNSSLLKKKATIRSRMRNFFMKTFRWRKKK